MLVLIGLRASGKTTVGGLLAAGTGRPFTDLDELTAQRLGVGTASGALRARGVQAFRAAELDALRTFLPTAQPGHILALGGGTPTIPEVAGLLRPHTVVYLRAQPGTLQQRLGNDPRERPALTAGDAVSEVPTLFAERDPLYRSIAAHIIDTDAMTTEGVLGALLRLVA